MKKSLLGLFTFILLAGLVTSCEKEDEVKSSVKEITSFTLEGKTGVIDKVAKTIQFPEFPYTKYEALKTAVPSIEYLGERVVPSPGTPKDFTTPQKYWVSAEDGTALEFTVIVPIGVNNIALVESYKVSDPVQDTVYTAVVDNKARTITLELPYALNGQKLKTVIQVSNQATYPASFNNVVYDVDSDIILPVTAGDGVTVNDYDIIIKLGKNSTAEITSLIFTIEGVEYPSTIDQTKKEIKVTFPSDAELSELEYKMVKSSGAEIITPEDFEDEGVYDFSTTKEFIIQPEMATEQPVRYTFKKTFKK